MIEFFVNKIFLHISQFVALNKCIFHTNNHKVPTGWVISVEIFLGLTEPQGNINKKETIFCIIPRQGFSHFRQLLQNPGLTEMNCFAGSPIYSVKNLKSTALFWGVGGIKYIYMGPFLQDGNWP